MTRRITITIDDTNPPNRVNATVTVSSESTTDGLGSLEDHIGRLAARAVAMWAPGDKPAAHDATEVHRG